jgi:purine-binding chemotaxis protein CheW
MTAGAGRSQADRGRDEQAILRERAKALARRADTGQAEPAIELLEFGIGGQAYGIETSHLAGVLPLRQLTPLPGTPSFIAGIVNLRGRVTAVLDLRRFVEVPASGLSDLRHLVHVQGQGLDLCLLATRVAGVRRLRLDELHPAPPGLAGRHPEHLRGIAADGLLLLDVDRLLADPRLSHSDTANS